MAQQLSGRVTASHEWSELELPSAVSDRVLLASIDTYNGRNTADVRMRNVDSAIIELFVEEERSVDDEIRHNVEDIGFFATETGPVTDHSGTTIGEAGVLYIDQPDPGTWHTVSLDGSYTSPVAFAQLMTYNGENPSHTRIRNVSSGSFEFQIEEWDYLDGRHEEEMIGYVVIEEGIHYLAGGVPLEVGTTSATHAWSSVGFSAPVGTDPVFIGPGTTKLS